MSTPPPIPIPIQISTTPAVQVACRFRPKTAAELSLQSAPSLSALKIDNKSILITDTPTSSHQFSFDHVFSPTSTQKEVYDNIVAPLVKDTLNGYNCTVIAYGQTGSGKTHTMSGPPSVAYDGEEAGILPRVAETLFNNTKSNDVNDNGSEYSFMISMSVIEIYLERIVDLLDPTSKKTGIPSNSNSNSQMLRIREDASGGVYLDGVVERIVSSSSELLSCLEIAGKKRSTGGHAMNAHSSRSHLVAILTVSQKCAGVTTVGKLYIADLAGSEMVRKTEAEGQRLKEAQAINRSLSALGNVINALTQKQEGKADSTSATHVPYRDSKLTRLLQDSLGGNAKTALIVTASISSSNVNETLSTLRFGTRAKRLRNKPRVNAERSVKEYRKLMKESDLKVAELVALVAELQNEVYLLKKALAVGSGRNGVQNLKEQHRLVVQVQVDEDEDDDEGMVWLSNNDSDLKPNSLEKEELVNMRIRVVELESLLRMANMSEIERSATRDAEAEKLREDVTKLEADGFKSFTQGWQIGHKSAADAYNSEDMDTKRRNSSSIDKVEIERCCQICGLSEAETADHETCDGESSNNSNTLGALFTCDGNCCTFIHVACAGLKSIPTGEWFCADCQEDVQIDDPLPSPMRKDHDDFESAAAASISELSAVRGRFVALRKQRDRLLSRWKGERETQRRVEMTKRKLRRKREEEILRLREVVLVLQEEVNLSSDDRTWLMQVMDNSVAFSPSRMKSHSKARDVRERREANENGTGNGDGVEAFELVDDDKSNNESPSMDPTIANRITLELETTGLAMRNLIDSQQTPKDTQLVKEIEVMKEEKGSMEKRFLNAKGQILKQQKQMAKLMEVIKEQQEKLAAGSGRSRGDSKEIDLMFEVNVSNNSNNSNSKNNNSPTPPSPLMSTSDKFALKRVGSWWNGVDNNAAPEAPDLARRLSTGSSKAENLTAPFRNRLVNLLGSIEKEAEDYRVLKGKVVEENRGRREETTNTEKVLLGGQDKDERRKATMKRWEERIEKAEQAATVNHRKGSDLSDSISAAEQRAGGASSSSEVWSYDGKEDEGGDEENKSNNNRAYGLPAVERRLMNPAKLKSSSVKESKVLSQVGTVLKAGQR